MVVGLGFSKANSKMLVNLFELKGLNLIDDKQRDKTQQKSWKPVIG
jgi:hypothetical protein